MARAEVEAMLLQNGKQALPVVWVPPRRVDDYRRQVRHPPPLHSSSSVLSRKQQHAAVTVRAHPDLNSGDTKLNSPAGVCTHGMPPPSTHPSS